MNWNPSKLKDRFVPNPTRYWYSLQPFPRLACAVIFQYTLELLKQGVPLRLQPLVLGRIGRRYEDGCACCDLCGSCCSRNRNLNNVSPAFWALKHGAPAGAPTHRIWDNFLVASDHGISGLCSRRSSFRRKELCPEVNRVRTHTEV